MKKEVEPVKTAVTSDDQTKRSQSRQTVSTLIGK